LDVNRLRKNVVYLGGVMVPRYAVGLIPPDVTRSCGYYRLLNLVDQHPTEWCMFDMGSEKLVKRIKYRVTSPRVLGLGHRYALIPAGRRLYIKLREGQKPTGEAGDFYGKLRKDERAVSDRKSFEDFICPR
jgi:hypothetical protein